jgi:hypothetical protein
MGRTKKLFEEMMQHDTNEFIFNKSFFYETLNIEHETNNKTK